MKILHLSLCTFSDNAPNSNNNKRKVGRQYFIQHQGGIQNRLCLGPEKVRALRRLCHPHEQCSSRVFLPEGGTDSFEATALFILLCSLLAAQGGELTALPAL